MYVEGSSSGEKANRHPLPSKEAPARLRTVRCSAPHYILTDGPHKWGKTGKGEEQQGITSIKPLFLEPTSIQIELCLKWNNQSLNGLRIDLRIGALLQFPTFFYIVKLLSFTFSITLFKFQLLQITKISTETHSSVVTQMIFDSADKENQV